MDNGSASPLASREDLSRFLTGLLSPLAARAVPGGFRLGEAGARYSPKIALMEGFCRSLWGAGPLAAGGWPLPHADTFRAVLRQGVTPGSAGWGEGGDYDQRLVEMAPLSFGVLLGRRELYDTLDTESRNNLVRYLASGQRRALPANNWHFFRIMVCLVFRSLGLPVDSEREAESFALLESCYRGSGWYQDGKDGTFDYYNAWAFHFFALVYAKLAPACDNRNETALRAERYRERARQFAPRFARWFAAGGEAVPFGRSLTYRFAACSFWGACAFADLEALPWPVMKGLFFRNLRWWKTRPLFGPAGTPSACAVLPIGYSYANTIGADQYNSPGSPYWAFQAFLPLALDAGHPFWQAGEAPLPPDESVQACPVTQSLSARAGDDARLFFAVPPAAYDMNWRAEKYCKFAYSARAGFCASISPFDEERLGCDSMLFFRDENGCWHGRRGSLERRLEGRRLISRWRPLAGVEVLTTLTVEGRSHILEHRITCEAAYETLEGGFSLPRYGEFETSLREEALPLTNAGRGETEAALILPWGASRLRALEPESRRKGGLVTPAPNLNLLSPQVAVPVLRGPIPAGGATLITEVSLSH